MNVCAAADGVEVITLGVHCVGIHWRGQSSRRGGTNDKSGRASSHGAYFLVNEAEPRKGWISVDCQFCCGAQRLGIVRGDLAVASVSTR